MGHKENIKIKQHYPHQQQCQPSQSRYVSHLLPAYMKHMEQIHFVFNTHEAPQTAHIQLPILAG